MGPRSISYYHLTRYYVCFVYGNQIIFAFLPPGLRKDVFQEPQIGIGPDLKTHVPDLNKIYNRKVIVFEASESTPFLGRSRAPTWGRAGYGRKVPDLIKTLNDKHVVFEGGPGSGPDPSSLKVGSDRIWPKRARS